MIAFDIDNFIDITMYIVVKNAEIPHHILIADTFGTMKAKVK
jgi:hypothetical protein